MEAERLVLLGMNASTKEEIICEPIHGSWTLKKPSYKQLLLQWLELSWLQGLIVVLLGYIGVILTILAVGGMLSSYSPLQPSYSPAHEAIQAEVQQLQFPNHGEYSLYSGEPSQDTDEAWHRLTAPLMISASREEMERGGEDPAVSVQLAGGGYLASTGVYHELHCLKRMRWYLYRDTYYHNLTEMEDAYLKGHIDHCIETLRIIAMCQADVSLYSYEWRKHDNYTRQERKSSSKQVCVKWDALALWMEQRSVSWHPSLVAPDP